MRYSSNVGAEHERILIKEAAGRTPHLKSLHLELPNVLGSSVVRWLSKSPLLEPVSLPTDYQITTIVEALGRLTYLTRLKFHNERWYLKEETTDRCFSFDSPSGFPRLETLSIEAPIDWLVKLFQTSERFAQLKQIALWSDNPTPERTFNLTAAVAKRCPGITAINLYLVRSTDGDKDCSLSFQQTRPLLACHSLKIFEIITLKPFSINEQDLKDMALAWPGIQKLNLASTACEERSLGGFPLRLLPIAAGLFPTLQILRMYLEEEDDAPEFDYDTLPSSEFQSLRVLDVGASSVPADPSIDMGFIIGSICKLEVRIEGKFQFCLADPHVPGWYDVQDAVTMLVKSKRGIPGDLNVMLNPE